MAAGETLRNFGRSIPRAFLERSTFSSRRTHEQPSRPLRDVLYTAGARVVETILYVGATTAFIKYIIDNPQRLSSLP